MNPLLRLAVFIACLVAVQLTADEHRHRVFGLFATNRIEDFQKLFLDFPEVKLVRVDYAVSVAVFNYDAPKLGGGKSEKALENLDTRIRNASRGTFGIKPLSTTPRQKLERIDIGVLGLDCKACAFAAYESVARIDGVEWAFCSFKEGLVTAWIDTQKTNRAALEAALKQRNVTLKSTKGMP